MLLISVRHGRGDHHLFEGRVRPLDQPLSQASRGPRRPRLLRRLPLRHSLHLSGKTNQLFTFSEHFLFPKRPRLPGNVLKKMALP